MSSSSKSNLHVDWATHAAAKYACEHWHYSGCMPAGKLVKVEAPVSKIAATAIRFLRKQSPGLRLIVSYADPEQGHHGGIYQAGNWIYSGTSKPQQEVIVNGKIMHKRSANALFGTIKGLQKSKLLWKHRYLMPLDPEMRAKILPLAQPYPKRPKQATPETIGEAAGQNRPGRSK
jgi:hypothetical protein